MSLRERREPWQSTIKNFINIQEFSTVNRRVALRLLAMTTCIYFARREIEFRSVAWNARLSYFRDTTLGALCAFPPSSAHMRKPAERQGRNHQIHRSTVRHLDPFRDAETSSRFLRGSNQGNAGRLENAIVDGAGRKMVSRRRKRVTVKTATPCKRLHAH
jgi:hypothetical protein